MSEGDPFRSLEAFHRYFRRQANQFAPDDEFLYLCYLSAYDALPTAVARGGEEFWKDYYLASYPGLAWYSHMCLLTKARHDHFQASTFRWYKGRLSHGREYMILEYPEPPEIEADDEMEADEEDQPLLAPYFSAVLRTTTRGPAEVYALGQSPRDGLSTLRFCRSAGHYNLGYLSGPSLGVFLEGLETVQKREILGGTVRYPKHLDRLDEFLWKQIRNSREDPVSLLDVYREAGLEGSH